MMDAIFGFKKHDDDYYTILGCDETSSIEQINAEFKARALETHPDKRPNDQTADAQFKKLHLAKETLTDLERRKLYDKWRLAGMAMPFEHWFSLGKNVHTSMHWAAKVKKDLMLEGENTPSASSSTKPKAGVSTEPEEVKRVSSWEREPPSESLRKFRNYEI